MTGPLDFGGLAGVVASLARGLPQHGITVAIVVVLDAGDAHAGRLGPDLISEGIELVTRTKADLKQWLLGWAPDVVAVHGATDWAVEIAHDLELPIVETLHGGHTYFGVERGAVVRRARMCTGIVAVSEMVRAQFLNRCPEISPEMVVTIPNGAEPAPADPALRDHTRRHLGLDDEFLFVSLARYCPQKNTFGLVAAFSQMNSNGGGAHLLVAGNPEDRGYAAQVGRVRNKAADPTRIHLRSDGPPRALLAAADAFVLDSFFEGWALASMEALMAGLPVVLSNVAGAADQLTSPIPKGYLVANPLGDPLAVDWHAVDRVKFRRQDNQTDLIAAMEQTVLRRAEWAELRSAIQADSEARFNAGLWYQRHAHVLFSAREQNILTLPSKLQVR